MQITRRAFITVGIALGIFLSALDTTITGTAMPTIVAGLGETHLYSWVFASYMLTSTTSTPIFGKLCDLFGQKVLYSVAIALFLLGSALSGNSQTMTELIVFRALQGIGAGGLTAVAFTIVGHVFSPTERPKMMGILSAVWAISSILGPAVGGFIVEHLSWRWVFFINIPIGIVPIALIMAVLKDVRQRGTRPVIDFVGAILLSASIVSLLFALLQLGDEGKITGQIAGLLTLSAVLLVFFIWNEHRSPEPMVPLSLFRLRAFSVCNLQNLIAGAALFGITGFVPLFVQGALQGSATSAGFALMPLSIGWSLGSVIAGQTLDRVGYRNMGFAGAVFMVAGFYLLVGMGLESTAFVVGRNMLVVGLGMGLLTPTVTAAVQNTVPRAHMGVASSSVVFYRNIGGTIGVSVMGAILTSQMGAWVSRLVGSSVIDSLSASLSANLKDPQVLLNPEQSSGLPVAVSTALAQSLSNSLHAIFVVSLAMLVAGVIVTLFLPNSTPSQDTEKTA